MAESSLIDKYSIQLDIPHAVYECRTYFAPEPIDEWLKTNNLKYEFVGGSSTGTGRTNGVSNVISTYMVRGVQETDAVALALQFPGIKVYLIKKYGYD